MDITDHSRVTVECHDPSGIYPLIQDQLLKRLPLRNLKWKSVSRPLRQIDALHVDFSPHNATASTPNLSSRPAYNRRSVTTPVGDHHPERRHQIPGLRQTPYVKVYLVRCDDKEAYKSKVRKQIQTWLSANSPPTQSTTALNKHQYHDACDLLILHVVLPGTTAAGEPRWSQHSSQDSDELAERSKRSPWPTKSGTTVLDKIRANFSIHAKNDFDRVAQVRLQQLPNALPTATAVPAYPETPQEQEQAWQDFMSKLKTSILHSFDLRVSQYEDDIRDKEAQRSLPGWNFCTFFTLKEGLAHGFESVGLVEDSLAIYEELSAGLDAVAREDTTLLGDMSDFRSIMHELLRNNDQDLLHRVTRLSTRPLDLSIYEHRNMIVSSTISVFDFKTYLFTREKSLLYRLADYGQALDPNLTPELSLVSEVCTKAAAFVTSNTRVLRHELRVGQDDLGQECKDLIDAVCASWAYACIEQVLEDTDTLNTKGEVDLSARLARSDPTGVANAHPTRTSSLAAKPDSKSRHKSAFEDTSSSQATPSSDPSLAELVAARADLFLLQRRILESLAGRRSWYAGLAVIEKARQNLIEPDAKAEIADVCLRVLTPSLATALMSLTTFQAAYETLSDLAIRHYLLGNRSVAAEALLGDIALLKFQIGDHSSAVQHFQRVSNHPAITSKDPVQIELLRTYATCLKQLNRRDEFIRVSLRALHAGQAEGTEATRALKEIIEASQRLTYDYVVSFADFFPKHDIRPYVEHFSDRDGVFIHFNCMSDVTDDIVYDQISLEMMDANDSKQELVLSSDGPVASVQGQVNTRLQSIISTCGQFMFDRLVLQIGRFHFVHNFQTKEKQTAFAFANGPHFAETSLNIRGPSLVCYPRKESLEAVLSMSTDIHVGQRRSLHLDILIGSISHKTINVRLRPASAGLRLYTSDVKVISGSVVPVDVTGRLAFQDLEADSAFTLRIPYSLETSLPEIVVKLEIDYTTEMGAFTFLSTTNLISSLALDVEVNDVYKTDKLYSRFRVRTNDGLPLLVDSANLTGSAQFSVHACPQADEMIVFEQQPLSLCYRISRRDKTKDQGATPLRLDLAYRRLDDGILSALCERFSASLGKSEFSDLSRVLLPYLQETVKYQLSPELLESSLLMNAFEIPGFEALEWTKLVRALDPDRRISLHDWLTRWHAENSLLELTDAARGKQCTLSVPMEVARIDILQTVRLRFLPEQESTGRQRVNTPVSCFLDFTFSRAWADQSIIAPSGSVSEPKSFTYAIRPNRWLIAGPVRGTFSVREGETYSIPLTIVPTYTGLCSLPGVDVAPTSAVSTSSSQATAKVVYRTDYVSAMEKVRILPECQVVRAEVCREDRGQSSDIDRTGLGVGNLPAAETVSQVY